MKTILAIRGVGNCGKSTTLGYLIEMIKAAYPGATFDEDRFKVDITIVITIDGKKIGIETQGDPNSRLGASLNRFIEIGCEVIICATRSYGSTIDLVNTAAGRGYQLRWFEKRRNAKCHDRLEVDKAAAEEVFSVFRNAINV